MGREQIRDLEPREPDRLAQDAQPNERHGQTRGECRQFRAIQLRSPKERDPDEQLNRHPTAGCCQIGAGERAGQHSADFRRQDLDVDAREDTHECEAAKGLVTVKNVTMAGDMYLDSAGRVGAPCRRPSKAAINKGSDSTGMMVMQTLELLPIRRVIIDVRCGIIISPPMPATRRPAGISRYQPKPRREASGRDRCRATPIAEIASASVTANFRSKNGFFIAVMMSGRTPSSAKNSSSETGAAASSASIST